MSFLWFNLNPFEQQSETPVPDKPDAGFRITCSRNSSVEDGFHEDKISKELNDSDHLLCDWHSGIGR